MNQYGGTSFRILIPVILLCLLAGFISWMLSFFLLMAFLLFKGFQDAGRLNGSRLYSFISALNQMIIRTSDEESLFREVCRIATDVGKFRMAWIGVKHPEKNEIVPLVFSGYENNYLSQISIAYKPDDPNGNGPTGTAIQTGKTVVCKDISSDPKMTAWKEEASRRNYRSSISLPIFKLGEIAGAFTLYATVVNYFDDTEVQLLEQAAADVSFALDVLETDKQKNAAEADAARSEKRYQALADISPVGIFHATSDGRTTYVNPKWCSITGIGMEQALACPWTNAVHPDDKERVERNWKACFLGEGEGFSEFRLLRPDGSIPWVIAQTAPDYGASGDAIGFVGILTDITNRKKAQEEIENNEKRFRALIENSTDGLTVVSRDGIVLEMGPSGKRILGYNEEDIVGKVRFDLIYPDDFAIVHDAFIEVVNFPSHIKTIEYRHVMPNGDLKWLECSFNNLLDKPYLNAVVLNYRDISGRKLAEMQIQSSEHKYRKAEALGKLGHWELDPVSKILYCSDEIYKIYGLRKIDFANRYESFLSTVYPDDRRMVEDAQLALLGGTKNMDLVHRIVTAAGEIKNVHQKAQSVSDESGQLIRLTGTVQDVTSLMQARNEILLEKQLSDSIINSLPGVFYLYTREGRFLRWNVNFEQVTGYAAGEIRNMHPLDFFEGREKERMAGKIEQVFRQGQSWIEANFHLKNRKKIPYYFTGRAIEYDGRQCLIGVGIDISERVAAQEKMKETSEQLRQLAAHLQDIREQERISMAREIHDELGQQLTALKMDVYWLKDELAERDDTAAQLTGILKLIDQSINTVRKIASELRPYVLDDLGLQEAVKCYCREFQDRFGVAVSCKIDMAGIQLAPATSIGLFRIFQESMTNIARHAEATTAYVSLLVVGEKIELLVRDNGKGFDINNNSGKSTLGLLGMRERVYMLDGSYEVHSLPGAGTEIKVAIPTGKVTTET